MSTSLARSAGSGAAGEARTRSAPRAATDDRGAQQPNPKPASAPRAAARPQTRRSPRASRPGKASAATSTSHNADSDRASRGKRVTPSRQHSAHIVQPPSPLRAGASGTVKGFTPDTLSSKREKRSPPAIVRKRVLDSQRYKHNDPGLRARGGAGCCKMANKQQQLHKIKRRFSFHFISFSFFFLFFVRRRRGGGGGPAQRHARQRPRTIFIVGLFRPPPPPPPDGNMEAARGHEQLKTHPR